MTARPTGRQWRVSNRHSPPCGIFPESPAMVALAIDLCDLDVLASTRRV